MAGQAQRGSLGQRGSRDHGQSSRDVSPVVLVATAVAGAPGFEASSSTARQMPTPQADWRLLQVKGMTPNEAASLTAFLYGLPPSDLHWTFQQLNQLLFLRHMRQIGRFSGYHGDHPLPH
jgi:hypothetical protein